MDDTPGFYFILIGFFMLLFARSQFPTSLFPFLLIVFSFLAMLYIVKGFFQYVFKHKFNDLYAGTAMAALLILFFNGLPVFTSILSVITALLHA